MTKLEKISRAIHEGFRAVDAIVAYKCVPNYLTDSLVGYENIEAGIDDSNVFYMHLFFDDMHFLTVNFVFSQLEEGDDFCIEVFDMESINGLFDPSLKVYIANHPSLKLFKDRPNEIEDKIPMYIKKEVPYKHARIACSSIVLAVQEFLTACY